MERNVARIREAGRDGQANPQPGEGAWSARGGHTVEIVATPTDSSNQRIEAGEHGRVITLSHPVLGGSQLSAIEYDERLIDARRINRDVHGRILRERARVREPA